MSKGVYEGLIMFIYKVRSFQNTLSNIGGQIAHLHIVILLHLSKSQVGESTHHINRGIFNIYLTFL